MIREGSQRLQIGLASLAVGAVVTIAVAIINRPTFVQYNGRDGIQGSGSSIAHGETDTKKTLPPTDQTKPATEKPADTPPVGKQGTSEPTAKPETKKPGTGTPGVKTGTPPPVTTPPVTTPPKSEPPKAATPSKPEASVDLGVEPGTTAISGPIFVDRPELDKKGPLRRLDVEGFYMNADTTSHILKGFSDLVYPRPREVKLVMSISPENQTLVAYETDDIPVYAEYGMPDRFAILTSRWKSLKGQVTDVEALVNALDYCKMYVGGAYYIIDVNGQHHKLIYDVETRRLTWPKATVVTSKGRVVKLGQ